MSKFNEKATLWLGQDGNTKEKLAEVLGISVPTLRERLAEPGKFTIENVARFAALTNSKVSELLADD